MTREISNYEDIIDSRDIIARIEWLEDINRDEDEEAEYKALCALRDEAKGYVADWHYGEALIRDSYFEEYAQDLAEDIGAINRDSHWPSNCIDWEQAARELQQDYTCINFDGVDYWIR